MVVCDECRTASIGKNSLKFGDLAFYYGNFLFDQVKFVKYGVRVINE